MDWEKARPTLEEPSSFHCPMPKQATDSTMAAPRKSQMKASQRLRVSALNRARCASSTRCEVTWVK